MINQDGRGCLEEALEQGYQKRWGLNQEDGEKLANIYRRRFPEILNDETKAKIIKQALIDIKNLESCLKPIDKSIKLYRNVKSKFTQNLCINKTYNNLGFSSCSLQPHTAENKMYGSENSTLFIINVPQNFPCIRLDLMKDVQNEPDEIILAPMKYAIKSIDRLNNVVEIDAICPLKIELNNKDKEKQI